MRNFNKALAQQNENINMQAVDNHGATFNASPENDIKITTTFAGEEQHSANAYTAIEDATFDQQYVADYDIDKFLSRPVLIGSYTMSQGAPSSTTITPWSLYFNTIQIRKKLDNYFLLNCNLHLKFVINATPFLYGSALVSYEPLTAFSADNVGAGTNANATVLRSQRPHLWLYPQTNQGGEMVLPFYYYQEWLNVTSLTELQNFGTITIEDVVALRSASGATAQTATIQIYAWAENVKLAGPTYSLALQNDEYANNGPISTTASTVAAITHKLGDLPMIGKYFKATSVFSEGLGKAASILGFTNTPVIDPTQPLYIQTLPTLASSEISFPEHKLTYDPKQELTVDPRVVGLSGMDEMDISNIVQRESYLTQFQWAQSDAVNTNLFTSQIVPWMRAVDGGIRLSNTPMAHVASIFEYWRGDIIVRFRFICSQYHRGRVRITWDPNGNVVANSDTTPTSITNIVDIAETTDVEMRIPYMQPFKFCRVTQNYTTVPYSTSTFSRSVGFDNGNINVKVFTTQTSQVSSAPIICLVSVRGAENLEFANPRSVPQGIKYFTLQNDEYSLEDPVQLGVDIPQDETSYDIYIGEVVRNLRTILRRRNLWRVNTLDRETTANMLISQAAYNRLPFFPGYDPNGVDSARNQAGNANVNYNWVYNLPYHWFAGCYLGCRGSVNYYYDYILDNRTSQIKLLNAQRFPQNINGSDIRNTQAFNVSGSRDYDKLSRYWITSLPNTNPGICETATDTSSTLGVQYPYYSRFRMRQCDPTQAVIGSTIDDSRIDNVVVSAAITRAVPVTSDLSSSLKMYFGVGTDFSFLFFLNVPILYLYSDPAAPS